MENDGKYFKRIDGNVLNYPDIVFPMDYHSIKLFASQNGGEWSVTEQKSGYRIGNVYPTMEEAIQSAEQTIQLKGINKTKQAIKEAVRRSKEGLIYNAELGQWVQL